MTNGKLITGLKALSKDELKRFRNYILSPYCNQHPRLLALFDLLQLYAPDYQSDELNKEDLCLRLYPGKGYPAQKILDELSLLYRLLKTFLRDEYIRQHDLEGEIFALRELSAKQLETHYESAYKRLEKKMIMQPYLDEAFHHHQYLLAETQHRHHQSAQLRSQNELLAQKLVYLDQHYLAVKLRESCEAFHLQLDSNTDFPFTFVPEIIGQLSEVEHPYRRIPIINAYYHIFLALSQPDAEQHFEKMVAELEENAVFFSPEEARAMYSYAQAYCERKIEQGHTQFEKARFNLYQQLLQNQLLLKSGIMDHHDYRNVVRLGLKQGEAEWVLAFLERYKDKLEKPHAENAYHYAQAAVLANQGEMAAAEKVLSQIDHADLTYQTQARILLVHLYFQKKDLDNLLYQLDAFKHFLNRHKSMDIEARKAHLQFLRMAKKIARLREKKGSELESRFAEQIQSLQHQIKETDSIAEPNWLNAQLASLL